MKLTDSILVGLDFTEMDLTLIRYAAFLSRLPEIKKVYFLHVAPSLELPERFKVSRLSAAEPLNESIQRSIESEVRSVFFSRPDVTTHCEVKEGDPLKELLHWAGVKMVSLILVGFKQRLKGKGIIPERLARSCPTHILFVPENAPMRLNTFQIPADFSVYSRHAIEVAKVLTRLSRHPRLLLQHVYRIPNDFYRIGLPKAEFGRQMLESSRENMQHLLTEIGTGNYAVETFYTEDTDNDPADKIASFSEQMKPDMIVIGAKGHTAFSVLMLGSITEKLLKFPISVPILIVKIKKEKMDLLDTLLS